MYWSPELKEKLNALMADTSPVHQAYIKPKIEAAIEMIAQHQGKSEIDEDCMVRAFILCVPRHLREGIHQVLTEHNYDLLFFQSVFDDPFITDGMVEKFQKKPPVA